MGSIDGFYNYLWLREDSTPYYAGKGCDRRAFSKKHTVNPPTDHSRVLLIPMVNEDEALEYEKRLIALFGRKDNGTGILRNLTDGGDQPPSQKGKQFGPQSEEHRNKIGKAREGKKRVPFSDEWKANIASSLKGNKNQKGVLHSKEWRDNISAGNKRYVASLPIDVLEARNKRLAAQAVKANKARWRKGISDGV